jgi:hypothetical protein
VQSALYIGLSEGLFSIFCYLSWRHRVRKESAPKPKHVFPGSSNKANGEKKIYVTNEQLWKNPIPCIVLAGSTTAAENKLLVYPAKESEKMERDCASSS